MDSKQVKDYFESTFVLSQYAQAARYMGLWRSEEKIFTRVFEREASLLELGCGAGRIAFGLHELGYRHILGTDFSKGMILCARRIAKILDYSIPFRIADATDLEFEDNVFDGAIFGFNGLMQIPKSARREQALREILRVIRPGAWFVFTTHDRQDSEHRDFWLAEEQRWKHGQQSEELDDFGDRVQHIENDIFFIHIPTAQEVQALLERVGFRIEATVLRSEIAEEPQDVTEFSDECRFWVVQKPG